MSSTRLAMTFLFICSFVNTTIAHEASGFRLTGAKRAEEVAEVMPELVAFSETGQPQTVRYHFLPPLMLHELQKQHQKIEAQQAALDAEHAENSALRARIERLEKFMEGQK